jgi:hypothetical protein
MDTAAAIEKIKKLLRLAKCQSATPAEAATALAKALQIAAENGINPSTVETAENAMASGMSHTTEPSQAGPAHLLASRLVKRHFAVTTLFDSTGPKALIHFIGIESNCQLAQYCYVYLVRASRAAWRKRTNRRLRKREAFLEGYFHAIDRMMPAVFHRPGLILAASEEYVANVILAGKTGIVRKTIQPKPADLSPAAFFGGLQAGKSAGIRNAVPGTDKPLIA